MNKVKKTEEKQTEVGNIKKCCDTKDLESYVNSKIEEVEDNINYSYDSYKICLERIKNHAEYLQNVESKLERKIKSVSSYREKEMKKFIERLKLQEKVIMIVVCYSIVISLINLII